MLRSFCVGEGSDRFGRGSGKAVRRSGNFRQVVVWKEKSCHKKGELQTGLGVRGEKLSQVRLTSGGELTLQLISRYMDLLAYS